MDAGGNLEFKLYHYTDTQYPSSLVFCTDTDSRADAPFCTDTDTSLVGFMTLTHLNKPDFKITLTSTSIATPCVLFNFVNVKY